MVEEILIGLLIEVRTLLNFDTPKTPQILGIVSPSLTPVPQILPSTDVKQPSPAPSKKPVKKKAVKGVSAITVTGVLQALNKYRSENGAGNLKIDQKLQDYAQSRADYLKSLGKLDKHAGHEEFMKDNGFSKLGFNSIAENQSWNFKGSADGLISEFYGKSSGHNKNQLNPEYTDVGIGISGTFTNLVFGGRRI